MIFGQLNMLPVLIAFSLMAISGYIVFFMIPRLKK